jgi:8-oxo-dGTP pyrophosphatase MutT (NUDIX family)
MTEIESCAGILFVTSQGKGLFLKRSNHGDYAGWWGLPGGHRKPSENHKQAARRECKEELGDCPKGDIIEVNRQVTEVEGDDQKHTRKVDYVTFVQLIENEFIPNLNKEHEEFIWSYLNEYPEPIHPGLAVTLQKINADELGIAKLMQQGLITSPQKYGNMWLFDIRITGTGLSYRSGHKEFVWRDKSIYLNDEFLQRCQGLPVIFEHPNTNTLNSKEYIERNIGSIFIPYIKDDEVWGIARVYDEFAAKIMAENQLSTSPAVVLYGNDPLIRLANNEDPILFESKPRVLDHVAICLAGVWDKGSNPTGVTSIAVGDHVMADEDTRAAALEAARKSDADKAAADAEAKAKVDAEAKAKADADAGQQLDKTLKCLDSIGARMDAFEKEEKERRDSKAQRKADKAKAKADRQARRDADEAEEKKKAEEKKEADSAKAKADAEDEIRKRISDVESRLPKQMTDSDYAAMADAQVKADRVYLMHGGRASRPQDGENLLAYRRRLANGLKEHSPSWKEIDLTHIVSDAAFANVEQTIYADAEHAGLHPTAPSEDFLREIKTPDVTGRVISTFVGNPSAWMSQFSTNKRRVVGIRNRS